MSLLWFIVVFMWMCYVFAVVCDYGCGCALIVNIFMSILVSLLWFIVVFMWMCYVFAVVCDYSCWCVLIVTV